MTTIVTKRAYDPPSSKDGIRILVDRLWPRGLRKDAAALDLWAKILRRRPLFESGLIIVPNDGRVQAPISRRTGEQSRRCGRASSHRKSQGFASIRGQGPGDQSRRRACRIPEHAPAGEVARLITARSDDTKVPRWAAASHIVRETDGVRQGDDASAARAAAGAHCDARPRASGATSSNVSNAT